MKTLKTFITACFIFITATNSYSQTQYPKAIEPGQKMNVSADNDTLWILKNSQYDNCIINTKKLKLTEQELDIQKQITTNRDSVITENQVKIFTLDTAYHHYIKLWNGCDSSLQKSQIEVVQVKKSRKIIGIVAVVTGLIIGYVLKSVL